MYKQVQNDRLSHCDRPACANWHMKAQNQQHEHKHAQSFFCKLGFTLKYKLKTAQLNSVYFLFMLFFPERYKVQF